MNVRERDVEGYLIGRVEQAGLVCLKFNPDLKNGMPDRLILLPGEKVVWVELKTKGGSLSEIQKLQHKKLRQAGHRVEVVWTKAQADELVDGLL